MESAAPPVIARNLGGLSGGQGLLDEQGGLDDGKSWGPYEHVRT